MTRKLTTPLFVIVLIAVLGLVLTFVQSNKPQLGLDLQGGASVVLQPPKNVQDKGVINQAIEIIRNRVDALGVAEPDIARQGNSVVIQLPGVKNTKRALAIVGQTAELRFRPVLGQLPAEGAAAPTTTTTAPKTTSTTAAGATTTTTAKPPAANEIPTTPRAQNLADKPVVLPQKPNKGEKTSSVRYSLGPAALVGKGVKSATAELNGVAWVVNLSFTSAGSKAFNQIAAVCYSGGPTCPTKQLGIELDGVVQSAPVIQQPNFTGSAQISGNFSQKEAKDLALVLRFGALPVQLVPQTVQTVSASLGRDSLHAGLIAGAIGAALVLLYMVLYYRALGLVVLAGLAVWGSLQWAIISYLGAHQGLALSLSGVTGIIVSIGVTVDSYVVYFERLKDEIRSGRSVRASVDRGFQRAFRTILAADISAFAAAAILYLLTVGPVRGFAFFLGLSTVLDVTVAWFFTRPLVAVMSRRGAFTSTRFLGAGRALGMEAAPA